MATEKRERQRANRELRFQQQVKEERRRKTTRRAVIAALAVVGGVAAVFVIAWLGGAFSDDDEEVTSSTVPVAEVLPSGFTLGTGACPEDVTEPVRTFTDAPGLCIDPGAAYTATIETSEGPIVVELDTASAPGTVNNFVTLARYGYYDDTQIFRADPSIDIVQGGGVDNMSDPGYTIPDEGSGFTYEPGQIVMARTAQPNSAGGQWFITTGPDVASLDAQGTYVPFGRVVSGLEIAQAMVEGAGGPDGQTPAEEVTVETVTITEGAPAATATTTPASGPGTSGPATTEPATTGPATSAPATTAA